MARKSLFSPWSRSLFGTFNAIGRANSRATKKALGQAMKVASPKPARAPRSEGAWVAGMAFGPGGGRRYRLFVPPDIRPFERLPLLVMLHGCGQDANGFAVSTGMNRLAGKERFLVLYPEQDRLANLQGCWNWYDTDSRLAYNEAATLMAAIDQVVLLYAVDPRQIALAGLSSGASMAALLATRFAARFQAVAMHSGLPPGVAHSGASAMRAMHGRGEPAAAPPPPAGAHWPPLLVIHGSADRVVAPANGEAAALMWAASAGARPAPAATARRGKRRATTVTQFKAGGQAAATLCVVDGLGHAWSGGLAGKPFSDAGGPDASRMIWAFAKKQFSAAVA